jgi:hypothetical protein
MVFENVTLCIFYKASSEVKTGNQGEEVDIIILFKKEMRYVDKKPRSMYVKTMSAKCLQRI